MDKLELSCRLDIRRGYVDLAEEHVSSAWLAATG